MTGFKEDNIKVAGALGLSSNEFEPVGIYEWPSIMQKIEKEFIIKKNSNTKFNWWWESFKGPQFTIDFEKDDAYKYLDQLIDDKEKIWIVGCDSDYDSSKFWLFQGYIKPFQKIIMEQPPFEYYLISKKYEWLLCETDHGVLIGLGNIISNMQQLKINNNLA